MVLNELMKYGRFYYKVLDIKENILNFKTQFPHLYDEGVEKDDILGFYDTHIKIN